MPQAPAPQHAPSFETLAYGQDPAQTFDLYPVAGDGPLIAFVHGGAWQSGSRHEFAAVCALLQRQGIAAATIDYRLSPAVRHPVHAEDVASALGCLAGNAKGKGYDPKRIVAVGHSAGGHILATIAADRKLFALAKTTRFVGLEGIYDVPQLAKRWPSYPGWFLNKAFGEDESRWPTPGKPVTKAPWLLVHSANDELVDEGQRDAFAAHLRAAGVAVRTLTPKGKTHDGVVQALGTPGDEVTAAIVKFAKGKPQP